MKKLIIALLMLPVFANAQYFITMCEDKMTDKKYALGDAGLVCSDNGKDGFIVSVSWRVKEDKWLGDSAIYGGIITKSTIGNCFEKDRLIFLFTDDTKLEMESWNSFNCEGNSYYDFEKAFLRKLGSNQVKAIRFVNGRNMESLTYILKDYEQNYFIQAYSSCLMKKYKWRDCSK